MENTLPKGPFLHLDEYHLAEITFEALEPHECETIENTGTASFSVSRHATDPSKVAVVLGVDAQKADPEDGGFRMRIAIVGYFTAVASMPEQTPEIVVVNCLAILYGILRGWGGTLAGWRGESFVMPTVDFTSIVKAATKEGAEDAEELTEEG